MLKQPPQESTLRSWCWVALCVLVIYVTIFLARDVQQFVEANLGRQAFLVVVFVAFAIGGIAALAVTERNFRSILWLLAVGLAYAWGAWSLRRDPEEALHFVQYGFLGILLFRAFSHSVRDPLAFVSAALLGGIIGTLDEVIQYLAPDRYFDFRDIGINVAAVVLMQLAIAFAIRPPHVRPPVHVRSIRLACRLTATWALLLLACFSNTLGRQTRILAAVPHPAFMDRLNDLMVEYGRRHVSPDGATFFSRLSLEETSREDATNAEANAALLDRYTGTNGYRQFHFEISRLDYPLAYEARVHLFRRDKYADEAVKLRHRPERARYAATIAHRETQLVEWLYSNTLRHSSYVLREDWRPIIAGLADQQLPYESPVSNQLFIRFTERSVRAVLLSVLLVALGALVYTRRNEQARIP